jgi:hypothetical protein
MIKLNFLLFLVIVAVAPAAAAPTITLPDTNVYYYWFRTQGGTVKHGPVASGRAGTIDLAKHLADGGTLYVLDPHTGGIAAVPVSAASKSITVDEFQVPGTSSDAAARSNAPATAPTKSGDDNSADNGGGTSVISRVITWIIGLAVLGGVIWFIRRLTDTKGQLLIDAARKVGVDVPNPDDLPKNNIQQEGKYEAPPVPKVQRIPEEAIKPAGSVSFLISDEGTSFSVGSKTTSIGRGEENDIVLADSSVSRKHARIEMTHGSAEIIDENSANGVFVNGQKIARQSLSSGDRLNIGKFALRYQK